MSLGSCEAIHSWLLVFFYAPSKKLSRFELDAKAVTHDEPIFFSFKPVSALKRTKRIDYYWQRMVTEQALLLPFSFRKWK